MFSVPPWRLPRLPSLTRAKTAARGASKNCRLHIGGKGFIVALCQPDGFSGSSTIKHFCIFLPVDGFTNVWSQKSPGILVRKAQTASYIRTIQDPTIGSIADESTPFSKQPSVASTIGEGISHLFETALVVQRCPKQAAQKRPQPTMTCFAGGTPSCPAFVDLPRCSDTSPKDFEAGSFRSWSRRPRPLLQGTEMHRKDSTIGGAKIPPVDWLNLLWLCKLASCWPEPRSSSLLLNGNLQSGITLFWHQTIWCRKSDVGFTWLKPWSDWRKTNSRN